MLVYALVICYCLVVSLSFAMIWPLLVFLIISCFYSFGILFTFCFLYLSLLYLSIIYLVLHLVLACMLLRVLTTCTF